MTRVTGVLEVPLAVKEVDGLDRACASIRTGVPLPRGAVVADDQFDLVAPDGRTSACQTRSLAEWPDGTIKWMQVDATTAVPRNSSGVYVLRRRTAATAAAPAATPAKSMLSTVPGGLKIDTGRALFEFATGEPHLLFRASTGANPRVSERGSWVRAQAGSNTYWSRIDALEVEESGPLCVVLGARGRLAGKAGDIGLELGLRFRFAQGSAVVEMEVLLRNPRAAAHRGGLWDLGDSSSVRLTDVSLGFEPSAAATGIDWYTEGPGSGVTAAGGGAWCLHQDSSGGEHYDCANHVDSRGASTVAFRGYRILTAEPLTPATARDGLRATPCLTVHSAEGWIAATVLAFWQNFPKALRWTGRALEIGLFPAESAVTELQGGEQKRHTVLFEVGEAAATTEIPARQRPLVVYTLPDWTERSGAVPYVVPQSTETSDDYRRYVDNIIDGPANFFAKRERIDEFGWRNFGDLYADHEAVRHMGDAPFVSHYNNQYDFIHGALLHYLRSGDGRWWQLADDAARHTIDIDIYHTGADRAAFSGGMFWHTDHYLPAATATHRTYSRSNAAGPGYGGGPSNEHNYTSGLLLYHYLSGDPEARLAVLQLADWVIAMDDGSRTLLAVVDAGPTGDASKTASNDYHKPGRGAGNSINALLDAYALSEDRRYVAKAEELIERCIHPADDVAALTLDQPERRWSYLVFLQVLGRYLEFKRELGELDYAFLFARDSLLHYADWMVDHERPYLQWLDRVLIPTETWPAHDIRKCHVLHFAARYGRQEDRGRYRERAAAFFQSAVSDVQTFPTALLTRPLVILCVYGPVHAYFLRHADGVDSPTRRRVRYGAPVEFVSQRGRLRAALPRRVRLVVRELGRALADRLPRALRRWF